MSESRVFDGVVVVGSGLGGLAAALAAAPRRVLLLTAGELGGGAASSWAQGGIAAALSSDDSPELHAADTVAAGAGLVDPAMAALLAREGPGAVRWLADLGAPFDRDPQGGFLQGLEAAHSKARIAKVRGDQAGFAVTRAIASAVRAAPHVEVREGVAVTGLLRGAGGEITGVTVAAGGQTIAIASAAVVLATGGVGGLYAVTTNPASATGGGLALAALAGACIADPEFIQFHPTAIDVGRDPAPLATEALRGEGAVLIDRDGRRFMPAAHPMAELAPRDVVARAIHTELAAGHGAFLDAREAIGGHFPEVFPTVFAACQAAGLDPRIQPIPVAPAAHYHMGGIATDENGRTSLGHLFAAGECACTGVHGANRLASNSLLEAVVFGRRAGHAAAGGEAARVAGDGHPDVPPRLPADRLQQLRVAMSAEAGVVRDAAGLKRLLASVDTLQERHGRCGELVVARLIARTALDRRESRGGHFRADFPAAHATARRTFTTLAEVQAANGQRSAA